MLNVNKTCINDATLVMLKYNKMYFRYAGLKTPWEGPVNEDTLQYLLSKTIRIINNLKRRLNNVIRKHARTLKQKTPANVDIEFYRRYIGYVKNHIVTMRREYRCFSEESRVLERIVADYINRTGPYST